MSVYPSQSVKTVITAAYITSSNSKQEKPDSPLCANPISYCVTRMIAPWQKMSSAHSASVDKKTCHGFNSVSQGRLVNQIGLRSRKSFRKWKPSCTNPGISSYFALISWLQRSRAAAYTTLLDSDAGLEDVQLYLNLSHSTVSVSSSHEHPYQGTQSIYQIVTEREDHFNLVGHTHECLCLVLALEM